MHIPHPNGRPGEPGADDRIRSALGLTPGEFWRAARGKAWLDIPRRPVQPTLFPDTANDS
jgi:hypothetical protein